MSAIILFLAGIAAIAGWWLAQQRLGAKPWLEEGVIGDLPHPAGGATAAKIGLGVFLAVAGCLFSLLISAYFVRKDMALTNGADWQPQPIPNLLWLNTGALLLSSLALQWAHIAAKRGQLESVRDGLSLAGALALLFLAGQLAAWRQLAAAGYFAASNPASAFFYLLTGIHGLHVLGGLVALGKTCVKAWHGSVAVNRLRLSVGLCTAYWHFLLLVWLVVFALLAGWADDFILICRAVIS
jgi:cytochrome c oxidase subunit 3